MPTTTDLRTYSVNYPRLKQRLMDLASIGAIDGGGCARLALTDDDKFGRDLVVAWMSELGLEISIDVVANTKLTDSSHINLKSA